MNVYVKVDTFSSSDIWPTRISYLSDLTASEEKLLKTCLGDSDGNSDNNVEVYNWDKAFLKFNIGGSLYSFMGTYPHVVKLVPRYPTSIYDAGEYHLLYYDGLHEKFVIPDYVDDNRTFSVFSTNSVAQRIFIDSNGDGNYGRNSSEEVVTGRFSQYDNVIYSSHDISCETGSSKIDGCLEKGDKIMLVDANWGIGYYDGYFGTDRFSASTSDFSKHTSVIYTVEKIYVHDKDPKTQVENRYRIVLDKNINWEAKTGYNMNDDGHPYIGNVELIKFTPSSTGAYTYVDQCSGRGICNEGTGLCQCFRGYTNYNCDTLSTLAVY